MNHYVLHAGRYPSKEECNFSIFNGFGPQIWLNMGKIPIGSSRQFDGFSGIESSLNWKFRESLPIMEGFYSCIDILFLSNQLAGFFH